MGTPIYAHPLSGVSKVPDGATVVDLIYVDDERAPQDPPASGGGSAEISDGSVTTAKLAAKAVTKDKIADGVIPTVPGKATSSTDGLMSKEDKSKLEGVASGANNYVLPAANTTTIGGVKQAAHVDGASGTVKQIVDSLVAAGIMAGS